MKMIPANLITAMSATSEDSNYPVSFLLDGHPSMPWKAASGVHQARLTFTVAPGTTGIAIFGTNATRAVCNLSNPCALDWLNVEWLNVEWQKNNIPTEVSIVEMYGATAIWIDFVGAADVALNADVTLTNMDEPPCAGHVHAAGVVSFRDPSKGLSQGRDSRSVFIEMNNGASYGHKLGNVRMFSGVITMETDDWWKLDDIAQEVDVVDPLAWRFTDEDNNRWVVFARFASLPSAQHLGTGFSRVSISIIEVK